jgi:glyoxylase-like metal-dependent hydrolase (beta-lactamase superfamily II)
LSGMDMLTSSLTLRPGRKIRQLWGKVGNIYIIEDSDSTYLVDCGMPSDAEAIIGVLRHRPPLRRIVCTHFHIDHIMSWIKLKRIFNKTEIWFYDKAKPLVVGHDRVPFPTYKGITKAMIPVMKEYKYCLRPGDLFSGPVYGTPFKRGFPMDRVVFFAASKCVLPGFTVEPTPGHTPDSVSFIDHMSGEFISGDFLIVIKGEWVDNPYVADPNAQRNSLSKILGMPEIGFIYPGHGICRPFP